MPTAPFLALVGASKAWLRFVSPRAGVKEAKEQSISPPSHSRGRDTRGRRPNRILGARAIAARVLAKVDEGEARSGDTLRREMAYAELSDPRDRALATELVYGTLRWRRQLDHALKPWVKQGFGRLEKMAQALLRIGAYQLLHLDRIPAPIAVSATQDAARNIGMGRVTGLINGVLRRVSEKGLSLPEGQSNAAIAMRYSLPTWIVSVMRQSYGDHALEGEAQALKTRAPNTLRPTLRQGGYEALVKAFKDTPFSLAEGAHGTALITGPGDPFATRAFREGLFVPQDPASLHVVDLLELEPGMRVLDLCAGRGIKATAIADRGAEVLAVDIEERKLQACRDLAERMGLEEAIRTYAADGSDPSLDIGTFDRVLVDAPCTGLGTLRRHPEIAWRKRPDDASRLGELQKKLLHIGARHVKKGGRLVYAVCTFGAEEAAPSTLEGFETVATHESRPSEDMDAFQAHVWLRKG